MPSPLPRPTKRTAAVLVVVLAALAAPAALVASAIVWTDRAAQSEAHAGEIALAALSEYGLEVQLGADPGEAEHAARAVAKDRATALGVGGASLRFHHGPDSEVLVDVEVVRSGLGVGLAELITRDDLRHSEATATLVNCYEVPQLSAAPGR